MSYILDALQRHEARDNPQAAAALVIKRHKDQRMRIVGMLVVIALIVNAGVLLWLLAPAPATESVAPAAQSAATPTPTPTSTPPMPTPMPTPMPPEPRAEAAVDTPVTHEPLAPAAATIPQSSDAARGVRTPLNSLPNDARARFPGLAFSTHIYAEDPSLRAVVANGRRLTEGDDVQGVRLAQITESGVLIEFENYLVEIAVIADWQ